MTENNMGKYLGSAVSTGEDMFVKGHLYNVFERGADHAEACPCVNYVLPSDRTT